MSNRTVEQISELAELKIAHELQIVALTSPWLLPSTRVRRFARAAGFSSHETETCIRGLRWNSNSPANVVWHHGHAERSLFAFLPGDCGCPVQVAQAYLSTDHLIPRFLPDGWAPSRKVLEAFAEMQQKKRFPV